MRAGLATIARSLLLLGAAACQDSSEGESCDPKNGDYDCEHGLVCTPAHSVKGSEPLCCPRALSAASVDSCLPELGAEGLLDPSIDASFAAGGKGAGGTAGSAGDGSAGAADSAAEGMTGDGAAGATSEGSADTASGDATPDSTGDR